MSCSICCTDLGHQRRGCTGTPFAFASECHRHTCESQPTHCSTGMLDDEASCRSTTCSKTGSQSSREFGGKLRGPTAYTCDRPTDLHLELVLHNHRQGRTTHADVGMISAVGAWHESRSCTAVHTQVRDNCQSEATCKAWQRRELEEGLLLRPGLDQKADKPSLDAELPW